MALLSTTYRQSQVPEEENEDTVFETAARELRQVDYRQIDYRQMDLSAFFQTIIALLTEAVGLLKLQSPVSAATSSILSNYKVFSDILKLNISLRLDSPSRIEDLNTALTDVSLSVAMVLIRS